MSVLWASSWKAPTVDPVDYADDPNAGGGPNDLHVFEVTDKMSPSPLSIACNVVGPATSTVTFRLWLYDATAVAYLPWYSAQVVTRGTVLKLQVPAYSKLYVEITAVANAPTGFVIGVMPT